MKIVRDSILNEKFIGYISGRGDNNSISIIKNPGTLRNMKPDIRAISTIEGDVYYVNSDASDSIIHNDIVIWMIVKGHLKGAIDDFDKDDGWEHIIAWQRVGNTNIMKLSEGYLWDDNKEKELSKINTLAKNIKLDGEIRYVFEKINDDWLPKN